MREWRSQRARVVGAGVAVLCLLAVPACTGQREPAPTSTTLASATTAPSVTTETFDPPSPEPTTAVPVPTRSRDEPAIRVARLPVGGGSDPDPQDPSLQCAHVTWTLTEAPIPRGFAVELAGFVFSGGVYTVVTQGCGTPLPNCHGYILRAGRDACDLALRALPGSATDEEPSLALAGRVYCPVPNSPACSDFLAAVRREEGRTVSLQPPPPASPEPPPTGSPSTSAPETPVGPSPSTAGTAGGPGAGTSPPSGSGTAGG